jgi:uncharacterized protein with PQ loop repeat
MIILGWIGSIAFSLCGFPQAWKCHKDGHSNGLSTSFLALWALGEICTLTVVISQRMPMFMIINYTMNFVFLSVISYYKVKPRKRLNGVVRKSYSRDLNYSRDWPSQPIDIKKAWKNK